MQFHPRDLSELDELTEEHLGFSALSEGLGFSRQNKNGLREKALSREEIEDADPIKRKKALEGTGAVAAGPARPVFIAPAKKVIAAMPASLVPPAKAAPSVLGEPAASRWLRACSFAADALLIFIPLALAWVFSFRHSSWQMFIADRRPPLLLFTMIFGAYFLLSESFGGQSLGKMLLGLRVVEDDKYEKPTGLRHAAARLVVLVVGTAFLGLGFLTSFRDPKRRPWQDRFTGSIVRRKA